MLEQNKSSEICPHHPPDLGHIDRLEVEIATLRRCTECEDEKPEPKPAPETSPHSAPFRFPSVPLPALPRIPAPAPTTTAAYGLTAVTVVTILFFVLALP